MKHAKEPHYKGLKAYLAADFMHLLKGNNKVNFSLEMVEVE